MSGLIGKAMRFAKSKQGKEAISKAQAFVKSDEGKEKLEELKDKVGGKHEEKAKPVAKAPAATQATPAPTAKPAATEPRPDPGAPTP